MREIIAGVFFFAGLIVMAGSAGDCDGKCMEMANTLPEMMTMIGIGLCFWFAAGLAMITKRG
jgi:hypothetical protein